MSIEDFDTKVKKLVNDSQFENECCKKRAIRNAVFRGIKHHTRVKQKAIQKGNKVTLEYMMELAREEEGHTASL